MFHRHLNKYCSQDWRSDFSGHKDNVHEETCKQRCLSSASCTGISWASQDKGASNRCVLCQGMMQYSSNPNWITYDKTISN